MSAERQNYQKAIETRLRKFVDYVIKKARSDDQFADELAKIFSSRTSSPPERAVQSKRPTFQVVTFLHENGEEKLRNELSLMTDSDLRDLFRMEGLARGKEIKTLERDVLISELIKYAVRKLNQGSAFLGGN